MTNYILHYEWPWWSEQTVWTSRECLLNFLRSGFVPEGCRITVEHDGELHEWDREADYAKAYRYAGRNK